MTGAASTVVFLHIGAAFGPMGEIQQTLWAHRAPLRGAGLLYVRGYPKEDVHASASLRQDQTILHAMPRAVGAWDRVAQRARAWSGLSVISHGTLSLASERDVQTAAQSLQPAEVHVVFTTADLLSQAYAHWHQMLTSGAHRTFPDFAGEVVRGATPDETRAFESAQDPAGILARWSCVIPPERIHVIVTATSAGRYESPWPQFCQLVGIDPELVPAAQAVPVSWLDQQDAEILRRVNGVLAGRLQGGPYDRAVKNTFAGAVLTRSPRTMQPPALTTEILDWFTARAGQTMASLAEGGYHILGNLDDLRPTPPVGEQTAQDAGPEQLLDRTLGACAQVIARMRDTRNRVEQAEHALADLAPAAEAATSPPCPAGPDAGH